MRADVPPFEVMRHTFWLGERPVETDPRMRRIAECIADIRPSIERLSRTYGDRGIVWALAAIIVHMAVEAEDEQAVAAILRTNARLLELQTGVDPLGLGP
jgi:hypothetical protein